MRFIRKYDHSFTLALQLGLLNYESIRDNISKSSYYHLMNYDLSSLFGLEYREFESKFMPLFKTVSSSKSLLLMTRIIVHVYSFKNKIQYLLIHKPAGYLDKIQDITVKAVYFLVNRFKLTIERACKFFLLKTKCLISPIHKCPKVWPNQISQRELYEMKNILFDPAYHKWSVHSIHSESVRKKRLFICRDSFYKYSKLLGFKRFIIKKPRYEKGIRASFPNEVIHADVTCLKLLNGLTAYIYILIDNFSRFIISYKVSLSLSADIALSNLKESYDKIFRNFTEHIDSYIIFLTDGGTENDNDLIKQFLKDKISIRHLIALKDIHFSNSMIEAVNKTLKYSWLLRSKFHDLKELERYLETAVQEYNHVRPHHAHKYQTPAEAYFGKKPDFISIQSGFEQARLQRIHENRLAACPICQY